MTAEDIKMHLTLLIKSIQENENLYFIWCLQVLNFEVLIILSLVSKHTWSNTVKPVLNGISRDQNIFPPSQVSV